MINPFENDGCTFFPDGDWKLCCDLHDVAFETGSTFHQFWDANVNLLSCVARHNPFVAVVMFVGVMTFGMLFYFFGVKKGNTTK